MMQYVGELSALLTACLWSCSAIVFTAATKRVGSVQVNITRLILAALYLTAVVVAFQLNLHLSGKQIFFLSMSGVVGLTLGDTFLFRAFQEIGARISMLIMSLAPAFAALLGYVVLDETLSFMGVLGIAITLSGVAIVVLDNRTGESSIRWFTTKGIIYAFLGSIGQGVGLILAKLAFRESEVNGFVATAIRIIASLVVLLPIAMLTKRYENPLRVLSKEKRASLLIIIGSVLGPFLGISFSLIAIEHTSVAVAATIMALVPILMLPLVRIIYKEQLSWRAIVGACAAVVGVGILFLR